MACSLCWLFPAGPTLPLTACQFKARVLPTLLLLLPPSSLNNMQTTRERVTLRLDCAGLYRGGYHVRMSVATSMTVALSDISD